MWPAPRIVGYRLSNFNAYLAYAATCGGHPMIKTAFYISQKSLFPSLRGGVIENLASLRGSPTKNFDSDCPRLAAPLALSHSLTITLAKCFKKLIMKAEKYTWSRDT